MCVCMCMLFVNLSSHGKDKETTVIWSRQRGQACRVPNQLMVGLGAGRNGCFVVKFSPDGKLVLDVFTMYVVQGNYS